MARISAAANSMTPGLSDTARYVDDEATRCRRRLRDSFLLGLDSVVFEELATVAEECRNADWDGYAALPVTQDTLQNAYRFLESLPGGSRAPSVGAEPDGHLTLEWHKSARRTLSISVSPEGDLHYAALYGPSRVSGTEPFFGDVPPAILGLIQRVYAV